MPPATGTTRRPPCRPPTCSPVRATTGPPMAYHRSTSPGESGTLLAASDVNALGECMLQSDEVSPAGSIPTNLPDGLDSRERELADFVEHAVIGMHWVGPDG